MPEPCATCGTRTHVGCLGKVIHWLVDLDLNLDPNEQVDACGRCRNHAANNFRLIEQLPHASGEEPITTYRRWFATQPPAPKKTVQSLWGDYRVDPDNFVPAVTKVLDIVHSSGPKVRWAVKLGAWNQVPMTNLAAKEIILPNYFDSPNALGRTHEEVLDAMTGAAMHEAGHAAYDSAATIIEAQRRLRYHPGESAWASSVCLNVVADYNLERKVIERYPAFRHYFTECHRWSVRDSLPQIVKELQSDGAEDRLNVRIAVLVWEMLGPGDLERAGATLTPKLTWIIKKCFDVLKYAYTKGLLNTEEGKLKTARALYELIKVVNPVGAPPSIVCGIPQPPQGGQNQGPTIGGSQQPGGQQGQPGGSPGDPSDDSDDSQPGGTPSDDFEDGPDDFGEGDDEDDDVSDAEGDEPSGQSAHTSGTPGGTGQGPDGDQDEDQEEDEEDGNGDGAKDSEVPGRDADSGSDGEAGEGVSGEGPEDPDSDGSEETGSGQADGDGAGSDSDRDGDPDGQGSEGSDTEAEDQGQEGQAAESDHDGPVQKSDKPGIADNTGPEDEEAGDPGSVSSGPSDRGGKSGSEKGQDPKDDPFTGAGDLKDDPTRRKNAKKDALDDLSEQNKGQAEVDKDPYQAPLITPDNNFNPTHRNASEQLATPPPVNHRKAGKGDYDYSSYEIWHTNRVRTLAPVIGRLKKILRFRNADWGGRQTGRRSGTLTRRHVSRLAAMGSDKVFHKKQPDATPKVRIALLVDESESMNAESHGVSLASGAKNAATALTQALHGIRGVKLWCWGYSMHKNYASGRYEPSIRAYVDPFHQADPITIEAPIMSGGTPTGEAMNYAAEVLTKGSAPDEKKVVFVITDGEAGGVISTGSTVRKWTGKVTFVHIGLGNTVDPAIPFYIGPVTDITLLPDLLSESVSEILR